jgi:hypothetical protein
MKTQPTITKICGSCKAKDFNKNKDFLTKITYIHIEA